MSYTTWQIITWLREVCIDERGEIAANMIEDQAEEIERLKNKLTTKAEPK